MDDPGEDFGERVGCGGDGMLHGRGGCDLPDEPHGRCTECPGCIDCSPCETCGGFGWDDRLPDVVKCEPCGGRGWVDR